jgi:hypothetical protein
MGCPLSRSLAYKPNEKLSVCISFSFELDRLAVSNCYPIARLRYELDYCSAIQMTCLGFSMSSMPMRKHLGQAGSFAVRTILKLLNVHRRSNEEQDYFENSTSLGLSPYS